ncbi:hypothetical protein GCM10023317_26980 [Actinopolymorpha pittospori]
MLVVTVLTVLTSCGVTVQRQPQTLDPSSVPYGLLEPRTRPSVAPASPSPRAAALPVYFVDGDALTELPSRVPDGSTLDRVRAVLHALSAGPGSSERARGISTAIPDRLRLGVSSLRGGTATVALSGDPRDPSAEESTLAVGQIVLSVTSVVGVDRVRLSRGGQAIDAPLVDGSLTSAPLTAADYDALRQSAASGKGR